MSFPGSFPDLFIMIFLLMGLAAGISQVAWGYYKHGQAFSRPPGKPRSDQLRLWQQLVRWEVVPLSYTVPAELEEFACARDFIQSFAQIGTGVGLVLATIGSAIISLVTTGSLMSLLAGNAYVLGAIFLFASLIGHSLGYGYGVWQLHNLTARKITYGDLQPRRLADYRSALFPWIAGALIIYTLLISLPLTPSLGGQIQLSPLVDLNASTWILETIPVAMLLALVTGEIVMVRIAKLPRLLLIANPQTAQRADNLLRAMTIGQLQGLTFAAIGYLGVAQGFILQIFLSQQHITSQDWGILFIAEFVVPWAVGMVGFSLQMLAGRIGGKISGWPWQPVRNP